jgi:hypothetical protein
MISGFPHKRAVFEDDGFNTGLVVYVRRERSAHYERRAAIFICRYLEIFESKVAIELLQLPIITPAYVDNNQFQS